MIAKYLKPTVKYTTSNNANKHIHTQKYVYINTEREPCQPVAVLEPLCSVLLPPNEQCLRLQSHHLVSALQLLGSHWGLYFQLLLDSSTGISPTYFNKLKDTNLLKLLVESLLFLRKGFFFIFIFLFFLVGGGACAGRVRWDVISERVNPANMNAEINCK